MAVLSTANFSEAEETRCDCSASTTAVAEAGKAAVLKTVGELQLPRATFGRLKPGRVTVQLHFLLLVRVWQGASKSTVPHKEKPF